jgi:hypothetical protein
MRYQTLRSVSDNHVFVVCRDGTFYELVPEEVRHEGPWQGMRRGDVGALKLEYRAALARDGYVHARTETAVFKPVTIPGSRRVVWASAAGRGL